MYYISEFLEKIKYCKGAFGTFEGTATESVANLQALIDNPKVKVINLSYVTNINLKKERIDIYTNDIIRNFGECSTPYM